MPGPKDNKKLNKSDVERIRKERMALVKKITHGDSDDEDQAAENSKGQQGADMGLGAPGEEVDDEDIWRLMGFSGFDTTKVERTSGILRGIPFIDETLFCLQGKQIEENMAGAAAGGVSKHKNRKYRQYMNRRGESKLNILESTSLIDSLFTQVGSTGHCKRWHRKRQRP